MSKDELAVGLSYFDKRKELGRMITSGELWKNVGKIFCIDGRYTGYEVDHDYSNDGSTEYLEKIPNTCVRKYTGFQVQKRQRYFDLAGEAGFKWLMVVDSDDYVHPEYTDWDRFYKLLDLYEKKYPDEMIFHMKIFIGLNYDKAFNIAQRGRFRRYVRIHKYPSKQRYCIDTHYHWCNRDWTDEQLIKYAEIMQDYQSKRTVEGIRLATDSGLRPKEELPIREKWAWNNLHEEKRRFYNSYRKYRIGKALPPEPENTMWTYDETGVPIRDKKFEIVKTY